MKVYIVNKNNLDLRLVDVFFNNAEFTKDPFVEDIIYITTSNDFSEFINENFNILQTINNKKIILISNGYSLSNLFTIQNMANTFFKANFLQENIYILSQLKTDEENIKKIIPNCNCFSRDKWLHEFFEQLNKIKPGLKNYIFTKKRFSIFCKRYNKVRFAFFCELVKNKVLENCHYTFVNGENAYGTNYYDKTVLGSDIPIHYSPSVRSKIYEWIDGFPYMIDYEFTDHYPHALNTLVKLSELHLIIETDPVTGGSFLTEKTYRAIYNKKPFIVFSQPNTLETLRKIGYKTFDTIIDESYDQEQDVNTRLLKIHQEIKKLNELSDAEFDTVIFKCKEICEHNYEILLSEYHNDTCKKLN